MTAGLNIEYNCEICGNYKYYGPRAFDRHFSEWRHTHGLKCLGIGMYCANIRDGRADLMGKRACLMAPTWIALS